MSKYNAWFDVTPEELEWVFHQKQWQWASDGVYGYPTAQDIEAKLGSLAKHMDENPDFYICQSSRLAIARDPDLPDSYEIFLCIGYVDNGSAVAEEDVVA